MSTAPAEKNAVTTIPQRVRLVEKFAARYSLEPDKLLATLKATAFKQGANDPEVTNEQMAALLVVADQYQLNPFTKEIYAFADKHKGVVPIVSVDGWARIVNERPEFNGMEFNYGGDAPEWIECVMHRKDRDQPIKVRELMKECRRDSGPWRSHPSRMLRHKAFIQCARMAFGFAGIYDEDEGDRIIGESSVADQARTTQRGAAGLRAALVDKDAAGQVPESATTGAAPGPSTAETPAAAATAGKPAGTPDEKAKLLEKFKRCEDLEVLALAADLIREYTWPDADIAELSKAQDERAAALKGAA